MTELSVIIVTFREKEEIDCVPIFESSDFDDYEIIIRDDEGISKARNEGIKQANAQKMVFVDDDAIPDEGYLSAAADALDSHPVVVGNVVHPNDDIVSRLCSHYSQGARSKYTDTLIGCNMAFQSTVFDSVGYFDEDFEWGHDETELADRLQYEYPIFYEPRMRVEHPYADSVPDYLMKKYRLGISDVKLHEKRGYPTYKKILVMFHPAAYFHPTPLGALVRSAGRSAQNMGKIRSWLK